MSVRGPTKHVQSQMRTNGGMVQETLPDALNAHLWDVHVAPDIPLGYVYADSLDVLADDNAVHDRVGVDIIGLLFGWGA